MLHLQHIYANIVLRKNQVLGEGNLIMKRFITLAIIASMAISYTVPVLAIQEANTKKTTTITESKNKKKESDKIKPTENKYDYINLNWWQGFNDEYLNSYIVRAIENNKDLKMATLTIDEFYENVKMQRASQLPTIHAGFLP